MAEKVLLFPLPVLILGRMLCKARPEVAVGLLDFFSKSEKTKGLIGYFGLESWWLSEFSEKERRYITATFQPLGSSGDSLTSGEILYTGRSAVGLLHNLAGWFSKEKDRPIAHKLLKKAEELSEVGCSVLDAHFLYGQKFEIYYKDRDIPGYLEKAVEACKQQIALAEKAAKAFRKKYKESPLPSHKGYQQLAITLEKQGKFDETVELCRNAEKQGWAGDWAKRIERCRRKADNPASQRPAQRWPLAGGRALPSGAE
jgi:tetratricopeptide (TPR) repeat protein